MPHVRWIVLVAALAATLAGCGSGSSSTGGPDPDAGIEVAGVSSPLEAQSGSGATHSSDYIVRSNDTIYSKKPPRIVSFPTGRDTDETSETGAAPIDPCSLVPRREATGILGGTPQITQEPQGPTCVYARPGRQITLAIESIHLSSLRGHARGTSRIQVASKAGWCLRYEATSVVVPLSGGRLLHVSGPCSTAGRFAALALPRVPG